MPVTPQGDKIVLRNAQGSSAEVHLYGATLTSWRYRGKELIFLSKKSVLNGTQAIRGGIPIVYPQFAKASDPSAETAALPQHGLARISKFEWIRCASDNESEVSAVFGLSHSQVSEDLRKAWPKKFKLTYTVTLYEDTLKTFLSVKNDDTSPFDFQALLHTYYSVPDIAKLSIEGFSKISYFDKVKKMNNVDNDQFLKINQATDRVFANVPTETIKINLNDKNETFLLKRINLKDSVVWNPWIDTAKSLKDFDDEEYKRMVCVEPGNVSDYITLKPGESWEGGQTIQYRS